MPSSDTYFKKGKSGNNNGRPDNYGTFKYLYDLYLGYTKVKLLELLKDEHPPLPMKNRLVINRILRAIKQDKPMSAIEDRVEGKPEQPLSIERIQPIQFVDPVEKDT